MLFLIYCVHVGVMWTVLSAQYIFNVKKDTELLSFEGGGGMTQTKLIFFFFLH